MYGYICTFIGLTQYQNYAFQMLTVRLFGMLQSRPSIFLHSSGSIFTVKNERLTWREGTKRPLDLKAAKWQN